MQLNAIKHMEQAARLDHSVISLGQGIPSIRLDSKIRLALHDVIESGIADDYSDPQGLINLRIELAKQVKVQGMDYSSDEFVITTGAIEGLSVALRTVIGNEKNEVIVPTPVYSAYFKLVETTRGKVVEVPLNESRHWELDVKAIKQKITSHTAAILICNPNNPTGTIYKESALRQLAIHAKAMNITLIVDEVYRNMLYDNNHFYSISEDPEFKKTVIRVMSFSKDFSLTGWRVGYLQADKSRINELIAVHDTLVNCAPVISQYAALAAVKYHDEIIESNSKFYTAQRRLMADGLDKILAHVSYIMPPGAYFFFAKYHADIQSAEIARQILLQQKLVVIPGSSFGDNAEGYLRLCFGRSEQSIIDGMERLKVYFDAK